MLGLNEIHWSIYHKQKWHCVETVFFFFSSWSIIPIDLTYCTITKHPPYLMYKFFSGLFSLLFFPFIFFFFFFTFPSFFIFSSFPSFHLLFFHSFILSWVLSVLLSPFLSSYFHSVIPLSIPPFVFHFMPPSPLIFLPPLSSGWIMAAFELWWFTSYFFLFLVNISPLPFHLHPLLPLLTFIGEYISLNPSSQAVCYLK